MPAVLLCRLHAQEVEHYQHLARLKFEVEFTEESGKV